MRPQYTTGFVERPGKNSGQLFLARKHWAIGVAITRIPSIDSLLHSYTYGELCLIREMHENLTTERRIVVHSEFGDGLTGNFGEIHSRLFHGLPSVQWCPLLGDSSTDHHTAECGRAQTTGGKAV